MNVIALKRAEEESIVSILENAAQRARNGQIRAFSMVEVGNDGVKLSDGFNDVRDSTLLLALVGGMELQKQSVLGSLDSDG